MVEPPLRNTYGRTLDDWNRLVSEAERFLREQARLGRTTTYTELNAIVPAHAGVRSFDFDSPSERAAVGALLGAVVDDTYAEIDAMLSSIVIYLNENDAGPGFYGLAQEMGLLEGNPTRSRKDEFWSDQVRRVHESFRSRRSPR